MDQTSRLIGEVAARYGIRLDPDDPAFALVALNQLALEDAVSQLTERMKQIAAELERSAESVGLRAGIAVAEQIRSAAGTLPSPSKSPHDEHEHGAQLNGNGVIAKWIAAGLGSGLVLFGLGLLVGACVL